MDPAGELAHLERMAQRAKERRLKAEAEERARQQAEDRERGLRELLDQQHRVLAGPPDGCPYCYVWAYRYTGVMSWNWWHDRVISPQMRLWPDDSPEPDLVEHCMCDCHGPDGYPLPVIAYA